MAGRHGGADTAAQPRRVLRLWVRGLLAQLAPGVGVLGTDFSAPTIENLQAAVAEQSWGDRVRLRCSRRMWQRVAGGPFRCGGP